MTIRNYARGFLLALSFALCTTASAAMAQEKPAEKPAEKPLAIIVPFPQGSQAAESGSEQRVVIPPQPTIIKKNPNTIVIPPENGAASSAQEPSAAPRYEQRPATAAPKVGSMYGYRRDPFTGRAKFHSGVDIKAAWGDPIGASHAGTIQFAGWYYGYGNLVIINHGGGITTYYAHLSSFKLAVGDKVERGTIIGYAGSTGRATSPHLHYEIRVDGNPVNPLQPLALDPSSAYFTESQPAADEVRPRRFYSNDLTERN